MRWLVLFAIGCGSPKAPAPPPADGIGYVKGQLHVHSNNSGDSQTPPAEVARWYREHGFDFIVFTDHNRITSLPMSGGLIAFAGVELTQNLETCDPPPADARLGCLLHVNALFVEDVASGVRLPQTSGRLEAYANAVAETKRLGGIAQLNHPNFHWGADAAIMGELAQRGLALFEVANQSSDVANEGDATHPSTEALWDAVLTAGGTLYGVATDDAHHYDDADAVRARGDVPDTGDHGWIMVHAPRDRAAIREAVARGDFYASTGVTLERIVRTADELTIAATDDCDFVFVGAGGRTLARTHGREAKFALAGARGGYVRATVTDARGRRAWVQPIRVP